MKLSHWRYSLSTLFILTTICAIGAFLWARKIERELRIERAWTYFQTHSSPVITFSAEDNSTQLLLTSSDKISDIFSEATLKAIYDYERIDGITFLDPPEFTIDQYRKLFSISGLKKLHFQSDKVFKLGDAECLVETTLNLQKFHYCGRVTPEAVSKISNLKKLEGLYLSFPSRERESGESGMQFQLGSMPSLRDLSADWPGQIIVSSMPLLKECEFNRGAGIVIQGLTPGYAATASLETQPLLESLEFDKTHFLRIAVQPSLKSLVGSNILVLQQDIEQLSHICKLQKLSIAGWLSNKAIANVKKLDKVQELTLNIMGVVEDIPRQNLQQLFENSLDRFEGLDHPQLDWSLLKECKKLTSFTLECEIEDIEEIRFLCQMTNLRKLDIASVRIKSISVSQSHRKLFLSEIIEKIGGLSFLDELTVGNIDVDEGKIKAMFPKTKVILEH